MKIKLMTDSSSLLTDKEALENDIYVLLLTVILNGDTTFTDTLANYEKYGIIDVLKKNKSGVIKTSQNNTSELENAFDKCLEGHDFVLYFACPESLSGQQITARQVAEQPKYQGRVVVVNNYLPGFILKNAMVKIHRMLWDGATKDEVLAFHRSMDHNYICGLIPGNNKTMVRSGRFKKSFSSFLDVTGVKVLIQFKERGEHKGVYRTLKGAVKAFIEIYKTFGKTHDLRKYDFCLCSNIKHGALKTEAARAILRLKNITFIEQELMGSYTLHAGLEAIIMYVYPKEHM